MLRSGKVRREDPPVREASVQAGWARSVEGLLFSRDDYASNSFHEKQNIKYFYCLKEIQFRKIINDSTA